MYQRVTIAKVLKEAEAYLGKVITVTGWARTIRDQKNLAFINLADGTVFTALQVVVERERVENFEEVCSQGTGTAFVVTGQLVESPVKKGVYEFSASEVMVEGACPSEYPLQPKRHSPEFLRTIAHLRPRTNLFTALYRLRSEAALALHRYFGERGFLYVHTPIITASDAEGAGEMFQVTTLPLNEAPCGENGEIDYVQDFFGKKASLTVSGQLNAECFAQSFSNVYTFGPTFRAEKSNTSRHAAEFWMLEPEISFANLEDDMALAEDMLRTVIADLMERCATELEFFNKFVDPGLLERLDLVVKTPFKRMTYTEAIEKLLNSGKSFKFPVEWGMDLQTEHERYICEEVVKGPVFVTDYPKELKAFYMRQNEDGKTVAAMDCLVPGIGEIIGGSQREERYENLLARIHELGLQEEDYSWYLDLRRYGSSHHAGFGLGFERFVMYISGVSNIRDVCAFPRTAGSAQF